MTIYRAIRYSFCEFSPIGEGRWTRDIDQGTGWVRFVVTRKASEDGSDDEGSPSPTKCKLIVRRQASDDDEEFELDEGTVVWLHEDAIHLRLETTDGD